MTRLQRNPTVLLLTPALTPAAQRPVLEEVCHLALWTQTEGGQALTSRSTWTPQEEGELREALSVRLELFRIQQVTQAGVARLGLQGEVLGIDVLYSCPDHPVVPLSPGVSADLAPCPPVLLLGRDGAGRWMASPLHPLDTELPDHDRVGVWCETSAEEGLLSTAAGDTFVFPAGADGENEAGGYLDNYARADGPLQNFALRAGLCGLNREGQVVWVRVLYAENPAGSGLPACRADYVPRW